MKLINTISLIGVLSVVVSCSVTHAENTTTINLEPKLTVVDAGANPYFNLPGGQILVIQGDSAVIMDHEGNILAENRNLIRVPDEHNTCPSRGLIDVFIDGKGFAIHQQNCSGWYFIDEMFKFEFSSKNCFALREAVFRYFDRRSPESEDVVKTLTSEDFGLIEFDKVDVDQLYYLFSK